MLSSTRKTTKHHWNIDSRNIVSVFGLVWTKWSCVVLNAPLQHKAHRLILYCTSLFNSLQMFTDIVCTPKCKQIHCNSTKWNRNVAYIVSISLSQLNLVIIWSSQKSSNFHGWMGQIQAVWSCLWCENIRRTWLIQSTTTICLPLCTARFRCHKHDYVFTTIFFSDFHSDINIKCLFSHFIRVIKGMV